MTYRRNKPILCPSCGANARFTRSNIFRSLLPPYCDHCGWEFENARRAIRRMLWRALLAIPVFFVVVLLGAKLGWLSGAAWIGFLFPLLFIFFLMAIPSLLELHRMRALRFEKHTPAGSCPEVTATRKALVSRILRFHRPRRVHIPVSIWLVCSFLLYLLFARPSKTLANLANAWRTSEIGSSEALFALTLPLLAAALVILVVRHTRHWLLLRTGAVTEGVIKDMESAGGKVRFFYSFCDESGRQWLHKLAAPDSIVYDGMPVAVFYNPRNPDRSLILEATDLDLVIASDDRPLLAMLRKP